MSLTAGEAGVSGMSGSSSSMGESLLLLPLSARGGAPKAAAGGELLKGLGLTRWLEKARREVIMGGLSGRGVAAAVLGVEVLKVFTSDCSCVWVVMSLDVKSRRQEMASRSISSFIRTFRRKGESEWGRMKPLKPKKKQNKKNPALLEICGWNVKYSIFQSLFLLWNTSNLLNYVIY